MKTIAIAIGMILAACLPSDAQTDRLAQTTPGEPRFGPGMTSKRTLGFTVPNAERGVVTGVGGFPIRISVADRFAASAAADAKAFKKRHARVHVVVAAVDPETKARAVVYKSRSDVLETAEGVSKEWSYAEDVELQPGEYAFQVYVTDPDQKPGPRPTFNTLIKEGDPFVDGAIREWREGRLVVLKFGAKIPPPPAITIRKMSKPEVKATIATDGKK